MLSAQCRYFFSTPDWLQDHLIAYMTQTVVLETIENIDLSIPGAPSLVLHDLSSYATLPFIAAFEVSSVTSAQHTDSAIAPAAPTRAAQSRVTYIALSKRTMPMLVDLYLRFKDQAAIYTDGTLEAICSVSLCLRCVQQHFNT